VALTPERAVIQEPAWGPVRRVRVRDSFICPLLVAACIGIGLYKGVAVQIGANDYLKPTPYDAGAPAHATRSCGWISYPYEN